MVVFDLVVVRIIVHSLFVFESNKYSELHVNNWYICMYDVRTAKQLPYVRSYR